jgi:hypothetical protein
MRFVVDKVALRQDSPRITGFYFVSIISPMLHIHLRLHAALIRKTERSMGNFKQSQAFPQIGRNERNVHFYLVFKE